MEIEKLEPGNWYWVRNDSGHLIPYRYHKSLSSDRKGVESGEFFVGSFIQRFPLSRVIAEANMPKKTSNQ